MSVLQVVGPQVNNCEQVSCDDHQMSVAGNRSHVSCDHYHQMLLGGRYPCPMSGRGEGVGTQVPCPVGEGRRHRGRYSEVQCIMGNGPMGPPPVKKRTPVKAVVTLRQLIEAMVCAATDIFDSCSLFLA